ncbi:hypothetical protein LINPERPRIM_LOCUS22643 [Linum perenne]
MINWKTFRDWMNKNWGVPLQTKISNLGDDLWMLECNSKEMVNIILALDKVLFGSSRIFLDKWTS